MFSTEGFQAWAKKNVVLFASIMTRIEGREDDALLRTYGFGGFPSMAMLDGGGEAITKKIGRDLPSMQTTATAAADYISLKNKVEAGEDVDPIKFFMARLGLGQLTAEEAAKEAAGLELDAVQKAILDKALLGLELDSLMAGARTPDGAAAAGAKVYELYKAGRVPAAGASQEAFYMAMLVKIAEENDDGPAFLVAYPHVRKQAAETVKRLEDMMTKTPAMKERIETSLQRMQKQLADLDAKAEAFKKA